MCIKWLIILLSIIKLIFYYIPYNIIRCKFSNVLFIIDILFSRSYFFYYTYLIESINSELTEIMIYNNVSTKNRFESYYFNTDSINNYRKCIQEAVKYITTHVSTIELNILEISIQTPYFTRRSLTNLHRSVEKVVCDNKKLNKWQEERWLNKIRSNNKEIKLFKLIIAWNVVPFLEDEKELFGFLTYIKRNLISSGIALIHFITPTNQWKEENNENKEFMNNYRSTIKLQQPNFYISDRKFAQIADYIGLILMGCYFSQNDMHHVFYLLHKPEIYY